jgi:hypothetical protein
MDRHRKFNDALPSMSNGLMRNSGILISAAFDSSPERYAFRLHRKRYKVSVPAAYRTMGVLKFDRQRDFLVAVERA